MTTRNLILNVATVMTDPPTATTVFSGYKFTIARQNVNPNTPQPHERSAFTQDPNVRFEEVPFGTWKATCQAAQPDGSVFGPVSEMVLDVVAGQTQPPGAAQYPAPAGMSFLLD